MKDIGARKECKHPNCSRLLPPQRAGAILEQLYCSSDCADDQALRLAPSDKARERIQRRIVRRRERDSKLREGK